MPPPPPKKAPPPKPLANPSPSPAPQSPPSVASPLAASHNYSNAYDSSVYGNMYESVNYASGVYPPPAPTQQQGTAAPASTSAQQQSPPQPSASTPLVGDNSSGYIPPPPRREPSRTALKPPSTPVHRATSPVQREPPTSNGTTRESFPPLPPSSAVAVAVPPAQKPQARPPAKDPVPTATEGTEPASPTDSRYVKQPDGSFRRDHKAGLPTVEDALRAAGCDVDSERLRAAKDVTVFSPNRNAFPSTIKYDRSHLYEPLECTKLFPYETPPIRPTARPKTGDLDDYLTPRRNAPAPPQLFNPTQIGGTSVVRTGLFMVREDKPLSVAAEGKEPYPGYSALLRDMTEYDLRHTVVEDPISLSRAIESNESYSGWGVQPRSGSRSGAHANGAQQASRRTPPTDSFMLYNRRSDGTRESTPTIQHYTTKWDTTSPAGGGSRRGGSQQAERYGRQQQYYAETSSRGNSQLPTAYY